MILKALYDYYKRSENLVTTGWEKKEIDFLIVINNKGEFLGLEDRRINNKSSQAFVVKKAVGRSSGIRSNLFWDNTEYVLGISLKKNPKDSLVKQRHQAFIDLCNQMAENHPDNIGILAVQQFFKNHEENKVPCHALWSEVKEKHNLSFLLNGSLSIVASDQVFQSDIDAEQDNTNDSNFSYCLVTGKKAKNVETTTRSPIQGSQATAKLVAFQVKSGYDSWGKHQGAIAPISEEAEFAYTTALNRLLAKDSHNKFVEGSRTFIFWASTNNEASHKAEAGLWNLLRNTAKDDPNRNVAKVREIFKAISSGTIKTTLDDHFFFLGLAPNAARIAVVYWNECSLREFAKKLLKHFEDMDIVDTRPNKVPYYGMFNILSAVTKGGNKSEVQPNLPEAVIKSIIQGIPYPFSLYTSCLQRIRAEHSITITRAAIIKAYINRHYNGELTSMINRENTNIGYLCGRLFAVLEKEQEEANNSSNIGERYLNAASTTPSSVFATLLNLNIHHEEKLEKPAQIRFSKLKGEIIDKLYDGEFPSHLNLEDQGRFMVGYYQQRQEFYKKK